MVSAKTVVSKLKKSRAQWAKIDKNWVAHVRDKVNGEWIFTVNGSNFPICRLEMKSPGGPSAPPKGTYTFGNTTFRDGAEAMHEANYWIADIEKGGGIKPTGWKKL